jgi:1-acyl-sn-glycerol-3-phosphate acyltransferase
MTIRHLTRVAVDTVRVSAPTILEGALGKLTPEVCDERLDWWSTRVLRRAKVDMRCDGLDNVPPGEAFVVMSNHQSLYDIPVLFQALKRRVRMVAKTELFRVPVWGRAMRVAGFVELDRHNRAKAIASLRAAQEELRRGTSIWIAPEGTRSETGKLQPFKKGGFHLALDSGARILPVSIVGTRDALLARGFNVSDGAAVQVFVHSPIDPQAFGPDRKEDLMSVVRAAIDSRLPYGKENG